MESGAATLTSPHGRNDPRVELQLVPVHLPDDDILSPVLLESRGKHGSRKHSCYLEKSVVLGVFLPGIPHHDQNTRLILRHLPSPVQTIEGVRGEDESG